jgi:hypothetical protein
MIEDATNGPEDLVDRGARQLVAGELPHHVRARVLTAIGRPRPPLTPKHWIAFGMVTGALILWISAVGHREPFIVHPTQITGVDRHLQATSASRELIRATPIDEGSPRRSLSRVSAASVVVPAPDILVKIEPVVVPRVEVDAVATEPVRVAAVRVEHVAISFP